MGCHLIFAKSPRGKVPLSLKEVKMWLKITVNKWGCLSQSGKDSQILSGHVHGLHLPPIELDLSCTFSSLHLTDKEIEGHGC